MDVTGPWATLRMTGLEQGRMQHEIARSIQSWCLEEQLMEIWDQGQGNEVVHNMVYYYVFDELK